MDSDSSERKLPMGWLFDMYMMAMLTESRVPSAGVEAVAQGGPFWSPCSVGSGDSLLRP